MKFINKWFAGEFAPPQGTFYLAYRGSIAHGMFIPSEDPNSIDDIDLMGFVFAPREHYLGLTEWGSRGTKEIKEGKLDVVLYEIRKAVNLLLQGNPNIMSMLWIAREHQIITSGASDLLVASRHLFVGKHVYPAFAGYAHQQMEKMETRDPAELREYLAVTAELKFRGAHPNHKGEEFPKPDHTTGEAQDASMWGTERLLTRLKHFQRKGENLGYMGDKRKQLVLQHGYDSKNAAHLIRLLRMCKEFMQTGEMVVERPDAAELLGIERGEWPLSEVKRLAESLWEETRVAKEASKLPSLPNWAKVEELLVKLVEEHLWV